MKKTGLFLLLSALLLLSPLTSVAQEATSGLTRGGFSYWGYRHHELHEHGLVDQLQQATGSSCCNGAHSGECRVSEVDLPSNRAFIDGQWCPITAGTRRAAIEGLSAIKEPGKAVAIVCASSGTNPLTRCPYIYCIGTEGGQ